MSVSRETFTSSTGLEGLACLIEQTYGVNLDQIRGRQQNRKISEARRTLAKMAYDFGYTYAELGKFMNKDHSSIMYMVKK